MKRPSREKPLSDGRALKNGSVPFYRELCAVQTQYDRMSAALDGNDPGRLRTTACRLVLAWLQVEAAFIRFIERTPAELGLGAKAKRERLVLTGGNYVVRGLFRRALDETANWAISRGELRALRIVLRWLHERLELSSLVGAPALSSRRVRRAK